MIAKAQIKKALVVLSPDLIRPDCPDESALLRRAVALARITGCELELFHVCYDSGLEDSLFRSEEELDRARKRLTDESATRVAEIATRLRRESVNVSHETRWDHPRTDAILRKIERSSPDLVLKQSREHSYVLGLASNTDWELARRSPVNVWLVTEAVDDIDKLVAAVGTRPSLDNDIMTAADSDLMRTAKMAADTFKAAIYPVNAYQLPMSPAVVGSLRTNAVVAAAENEELRQVLVKQHSELVRGLANYFDIPTDNVRVEEGRPDKVIANAAESVDADLIVIGARSIGRFERIVGQVTVEPVMSRTDCDILVVRDDEAVLAPEAETRPFVGTPELSLERAIIDPEDTFDSPQQVASCSGISISLRQRILQAWEYDIRAEMEGENEGATVGDIDVNALDAITSAREMLKMKQDRSRGRRPTLDESPA